jgi:hypothetical protein
MPAPEAGRRGPYALTTPRIKMSLNLRGGARGNATGTGTGTGTGRRGRTKDTAQACTPSAADAVDARRTPGTSGVGMDSAGNYSATTLAGSLASRVLVCVLPQGTQLANGLRHLCTCFILARHSNRALRIDPTQSMCASFFQRLLEEAGAAEPGQSSDGDAPASVSIGGAGGLCGGGGLERGEGGGVEYTIQIPVVREPEWREHSELVAEDAAYDFLLRQHPWTNWHPLVEGVCNLTRLDSKPRIALKSIYAIKPAGLSDAAYVSEKLRFYERLLGKSALLVRARACIQSLRFATLPKNEGAPDTKAREEGEGGGGRGGGVRYEQRASRVSGTVGGGRVGLGSGGVAGGGQEVGGRSSRGGDVGSSGEVGGESAGEAGVVGVHVRYTDNRKDRNKIEYGLLTDLDAFVNALREAVALVAARK